MTIYTAEQVYSTLLRGVTYHPVGGGGTIRAEHTHLSFSELYTAEFVAGPESIKKIIEIVVRAKADIMAFQECLKNSPPAPFENGAKMAEDLIREAIAEDQLIVDVYTKFLTDNFTLNIYGRIVGSNTHEVVYMRGLTGVRINPIDAAIGNEDEQLARAMQLSMEDRKSDT